MTYVLLFISVFMERDTRFELARSAWRAEMLPLHQSRINDISFYIYIILNFL